MGLHGALASLSFPSPVSSLSPVETSLAGTLLCRALVAPGLGVALLEVAVTFQSLSEPFVGYLLSRRPLQSCC